MQRQRGGPLRGANGGSNPVVHRLDSCESPWLRCPRSPPDDLGTAQLTSLGLLLSQDPCRPDQSTRDMVNPSGVPLATPHRILKVLVIHDEGTVGDPRLHAN